MKVPEIGHTFALHHNSTFIFELQSIEHDVEQEDEMVTAVTTVYGLGQYGTEITINIYGDRYRWHECLSPTGPDFVLEQI